MKTRIVAAIRKVVDLVRAAIRRHLDRRRNTGVRRFEAAEDSTTSRRLWRDNYRARST